MRSPLSGLRVLWISYFLICSLLALLAVIAIALYPIVVMVINREISGEFLTRPLAIGILLLPFGYGLLRGFLFHPVFDPRYRKWLANTPWTPKHPLPKGPLHLVWPDAVVVGVLTAMEYLLTLTITPPIWPFVVAPVVLFAVAMALVWTFANAIVGQRQHVYAVMWVPVLFGALRIPLIGFLFCPFLMAGIAWLGVRRSLAAFPWTSRDIAIIRAEASKPSSSMVGWPYADLIQRADEFRTDIGKACMEAALIAAWVWFAIRSIGKVQPQEDLAVLMVFIAFSATLAGILRLVKYGPVICARLCWGQRVANKQWLIPLHDQILLAPLLAVVVGWVLPWLLYKVIGMSMATSCATAAGIVILILRGMGPSIQELQYTGVHSKFGTLRQSKEFITARGSNS